MRSVRTAKYKLIENLTPENDYYIKYMMNPAKKDSYWNTWMAKAQSDLADNVLTERIVRRPAREFYDLQKDPYELHNLANDASYHKQIDAYSHKLKDWMTQQRDEGAAIDKDYKNQKQAIK
jgi:hypothetical protein